MTTKRASELTVGDRLIEGGAGGMEWRIDAIARSDKTVTLTLNPIEAAALICKPAPDQTRIFRKTTRLYVV